MSQIHYTTTTQFKHLTETERQLIENWLNEGESQAEIARRLNRHPSTISREIKRGSVPQIKGANQKTAMIYYAMLVNETIRVTVKNRVLKRKHGFQPHFLSL